MTRHGMARTKMYRAWSDMKSRCQNVNHRNYRYYGGRGIAVCDEWQSFDGFMEWSLSNGYSDDLTIDRIDNELGYCPANCRWATMEQQNANRRHRVALVTAFGETKDLADWASDQRCVVSVPILAKRLRSGISPEIAMTTNRSKKPPEDYGLTQEFIEEIRHCYRVNNESAASIAKRTGFKQQRIYEICAGRKWKNPKEPVAFMKKPRHNRGVLRQKPA